MVKEVPITKGAVVLIDDSDLDIVSQYKWHLHSLGYAGTSVGGRKNKRQVLMHRLIMSPKKNEVVDHRNGDKLDNRRSNLRVTSNALNAANSKIRSDNTSGYKGVTFSKDNCNWVARIQFNGKHKHLGVFDNPHDAARMYNFWALDIFGEYARLNIIKEAV